MAGKRRGSRIKYKKWLTKEGLLVLEGYARDGYTNEMIAKAIGINPATLYEWQKKYPKIAEALKSGKEVIDRQVENALLKNALGYDYVEQQAVKLKRVYYEDGKRHEEEKAEVIPVIRHKPAETTAQIFWLKNRKPNEWRDKQNVEHVGNVGVKILRDDIK